MVNTSCAVPRCGSTSHKHKGVKFHQFPRDERSQLWIQACKREDLRSKDADQLKNMHICSLHFEQRMYGKQLLKKSAVPTLYLPTTQTKNTYTQTDSPTPNDLEIYTSQGVQTDDISEIPEIFTNSRDQNRQPTNDNAGYITIEQFLVGCDVFLPDSLSSLIKSHINLSIQFNE